MMLLLIQGGFLEKLVDGKPIKKTHIVTRGYQQPALAEEDIYAPVARLTTLSTLLAITVYQNMVIHQLDVKSAFLKSLVQGNVFMKPPEDLYVKNGFVCKLVKALWFAAKS